MSQKHSTLSKYSTWTYRSSKKDSDSGRTYKWLFHEFLAIFTSLEFLDWNNILASTTANSDEEKTFDKNYTLSNHDTVSNFIRFISSRLK